MGIISVCVCVCGGGIIRGIVIGYRKCERIYGFSNIYDSVSS